MIFDWVDNTFYKENMQHTVYIAKGGEVEEYTPSFTYYGFRYAFVEGITEAQATTDLLTYQVMHSDLKKIGYFKCSDKTANTLMEMVERSDLANFYYFPTDCPHREKNGWTGDAQLSAAHLTYLFDVEKSYTEWLHNIRKAQKEAGDIPGIIPTGDWGYAWGNGPAWDAALFELPYQLFKKKGNCKVIKENAQAMIRYLSYILTQRSENGTIGIGLGDYLPVGKEAEDHDTPIYVTSTLCVMDMARKAQEMFEAIGYKHQANFARAVYEDLRSTIRKELVDSKQKQMKCHTQTAQAMALYYGVFDEDEEQQAFKELLDLIHQNGENFDCGILGTRAIFSVLAKYGEAELAYHMITKSEYPSFGHLIELGETSVTECFIPDDHPRRLKISHNHHFFGDIARVFIEDVAGLKIIDEKNITIMPHFIKQLSFAEAGHDLPLGQVKVAWERKADKIQLKVEHPKEVNCHIVLPVDLKEKIEIL
jgi:alpha-L-rhamnosidase